MLSSVIARPILHHGAFALVVSALVLAPFVPLEAQKGKPQPSNLVVTATLSDRDGDAVRSDGLGSYANAQVLINSGDLRIDAGLMGRTLHVLLGAPDLVADGASVPNGNLFASDAVLFVDNILSVPVGETAARLGRVGLGSSYPNHAVGFRYTTAQGITIYGSPVCVARTSASSWTISSSCLTADTSDVAGLFEENLKGKINHRFKATYTVPFALTVQCTANCPQ